MDKITEGAIVRFNLKYYKAKDPENYVGFMVKNLASRNGDWDEERAERFICSIQGDGGLVIAHTEYNHLNLVRARNGDERILEDAELKLLLRSTDVTGRPIVKKDVVILNRARKPEATQWLLKNWFGDSSMDKQAATVLDMLTETSTVIDIQLVGCERLAVVKTKAGPYSIPFRFLWATDVNWVRYKRNMVKLMAC